MNTYDVTPADVAAELPGMFPGGFTATSIPTSSKVQELIDEADTVVTLRITDSVGQSPTLSDAAAKIAKRFITNYVKAEVVRLAYVGRDPNLVLSASQPYVDSATRLLQYITDMGAQVIGAGDSAPGVMGHMTSRALMIESRDLGECGRGRY